MRRAIGAGLLALCAVACGEDAESWEEGRPLIVKLTYLQQSPQNPFDLEFAIEFRDTDGDLGTGSTLLFISGVEQAKLSMSDIFARQQPEPIDPAATNGVMQVVVKLGSSIDDGDKIEVGFVLEDAQGKRSNDPSVVLQAIATGG